MELTCVINTCITIVVLIITELFFGTRRRMRMAVPAFDDSYHFFDEQKHQNTGQYPHSHPGLVAVVVVVAVSRRVRVVRTAVLVIVAVIVATVVAVVMVRGQRVGNEVQERVAQQSAGREAQQYLQEGLVLVFILDGYEEEHAKRQHADGHGGAQRLCPESGIDRHRRHVGRGLTAMVVFVVLVTVVVMVLVLVVSVAQAQFRQAEEHEREQQCPADVLTPLFGRQRHGWLAGWPGLRLPCVRSRRSPAGPGVWVVRALKQ